MCVRARREIKGRRGHSVPQEALEKKSVNISSVTSVGLSVFDQVQSECLFVSQGSDGQPGPRGQPGEPVCVYSCNHL